MEEERKIKRAPWWVYGIFGVVLMVFNYWLSRVMAGDPFKNFVVMAFITNGIMGMGLRTVYNTLTKKSDDK